MTTAAVLAAYLRARYAEAQHAAERVAGLTGAASWSVVVDLRDDGSPLHLVVHVESNPDWCIAEACCGHIDDRRAIAHHIAGYAPAVVVADLASKRAMLDHIEAEPHDDWCPLTAYALDVDDRCACDREERIEVRVRILAQPFTGRPDFPI